MEAAKRLKLNVDKMGQRKQKVTELGKTGLTFMTRMASAVFKRVAFTMKAGPKDFEGILSVVMKEAADQGGQLPPSVRESFDHPVVEVIKSRVVQSMQMGNRDHGIQLLSLVSSQMDTMEVRSFAMLSILSCLGRLHEGKVLLLCSTYNTHAYGRKSVSSI